MSIQSERPATYGELLSQNSNFRWLWLSQIISLLGDWFDLIASAALLSRFTESGSAVGGLFVVRMLAPFLVSPLAGVAADRFNRKTLLILCDLARGIIVLGFLLVRRPDQAWMLYVLTALHLAVTGFYFPTSRAILPDIVSRRELGAANAISSATWSVMLSLGAAAGGLAAGMWGVYPSFIIDSATFLLSAFIISRIVYQHIPAADVQRTLAASFAQYVEGITYLRNHADVLFVSLHKAAVGMFISGGFQVAQVVIAEDIFVYGQDGAWTMGWMYALVGVGTGVGPIAARYFTGDRNRLLRRAIALSYLIAALGLVLVASLSNFGIVLAGTLLRGIGAGIAWVFSTQLLFMLTPDRVRGRVFATEFALQTLGNAIGAMVVGALLDVPSIGVSGVMWGMATLTLFPGLLWLLWIVRGQQGLMVEPAQD